MSHPRFFVPAFTGADRRVELTSPDAHHLLRVLRARTGDDIRIFDGRGREWIGRLASLGASSATVEVGGEIAPAAEAPVRITLALAVLKGDQMDAAIRDATAMGAAAIQPVLTDRVTVPSRAWASGAAPERWTRVAVASARQCGRAVVPDIAGVVPLERVFGAAGRIVMCVEPAAGGGDEPARVAEAVRPAAATLIVGPEGGWTSAELDRAGTAGAGFLRLGPRTLRAETVPAVALAVLWTWWGWQA